MAEELSEITRLDQLRDLMLRAGASSLYFKRLSPNDNSKNQIYLGGDYSVLNVIPYSDVTTDVSKKDSKRDRFKAKVKMQWLNSDGHLHVAPSAQLILYPKYPEVRLSGFLDKAAFRPSRYLASRDEGRILIIGVVKGEQIIGHVIGNENPLIRELENFQKQGLAGVLIELPLSDVAPETKQQLLQALLKIHNKGWIESVKLDATGRAVAYSAMNGGGYTLEAELGVIPNGTNEPDFLGWEIKQHKSPSLAEPLKGGALTLMTPEPTGGHYKDHGAASFVRQFGYPDKQGRPDRLNFGGVHKFGVVQPLTGLTLMLDGFDVATSKIDDINGGIILRSADGQEAAIWYYKTLFEQWARKHAKAAFIPSLFKKAEVPQYRYGHIIGLGEKSDLPMFLSATAAAAVYYDPGIKLENASSEKPKIKKRSQFRISPKNLPTLYSHFELIDLLDL